MSIINFSGYAIQDENYQTHCGAILSNIMYKQSIRSVQQVTLTSLTPPMAVWPSHRFRCPQEGKVKAGCVLGFLPQRVFIQFAFSQVIDVVIPARQPNIDLQNYTIIISLIYSYKAIQITIWITRMFRVYFYPHTVARKMASQLVRPQLCRIRMRVIVPVTTYIRVLLQLVIQG